MITQREHDEAVAAARRFYALAGVAAREEELARIEAADFGLGELGETGLQIMPLVISEQVSIKLLVLRPWQVCPQHRHPPVGGYAGKEETLRTEWGECYLVLPGEPTASPRSHPPVARRQHYTVWHEVVLPRGAQHTIAPGQWHWFQGGPDGAVIWSMCSRATDALDQFNDPQVRRRTVLA